VHPVRDITHAPYALHYDRPGDDTLVVRLAGSWTLEDGLPATTALQEHLDGTPRVWRLSFDAHDVTAWDSGLVTFVREVVEQSTSRQMVVDQRGLPAGVQRLLALAAVVPEQEAARHGDARRAWLARIGTAALSGWQGAWDLLGFIGETVVAGRRLMTGKARFRWVDLALFLQQCGVQALGIVTLISFLVGLILAFIGAVQLRQFGAQIYVADLVGVGITREMGAMMTGVILAGRTGAAFAAQLGTMQVNEEIDALLTMGIPPMEFLVLPRMLALMLMMPLLCVYADVVGMLAGLLVSMTLLHTPLMAYFNETRQAVHLVDCGIGVCKSVVFGALVALAGCLRGIQCGRSAAAVGAAATSAVVTGIVWIIASDGLCAVVAERLGI
jgi:phospholipid/cholesterol/gamma-HCH transport system permease protein